MADEKDPRIITPMPAGLVVRIDDFRFKHRLASRSEAIRRLVEKGLSAE
jgi:metal-responsive CopG/Arc/MetJ family transcriptional regulator